MSGLIPGKVLRSTGSWYAVSDPDGNVVDCRLKGRFRIKGIRTTNPVAVGDEVEYSLDENMGSGVIVKIHERHNYIVRKATKLSKAVHIIAANIDQAVVIASLNRPKTPTGFIDRFLTTAEAYHIPSVVVFNKHDLYDKQEKELLEYYAGSYKMAGYRVLITSVPDRLRLEGFKNMLKNKVSLLSGQSGVGKSELINAVNPELNLKVGKISEYHKKGKHTTTFAEMFPLGFGGFVIDTPGIKEFGLVEFEKSELGQRFPEFRERMHKCRFNNCLHVDEPGCAIIDALEKGEISPFRYENYLKMLSDCLTINDTFMGGFYNSNLL
ncbi:MAG TPA: ribosome small subunit-dependent GTPase A [Bacteroidetes bacterium]|nr:ribosome small subunit-dependent GTPase A [Bacteroidota bacterium]